MTKLKFIDLTHSLDNNISVYSKEEKLKITKAYSIEKDYFRESLFKIFSHNGTHIDAPAHLIENGKFLEQYPLDKFQGKALLIDLENEPIENNLLSKSIFENYEKDFKNIEILILKTGFYKYWSKNSYLENYPTLDLEAANYLASFNFKIIGFDTISPDSYDAEDFIIHKAFLEKDILILENLNLKEKLPKNFNLMAMPIKYKESDGSFLRAFAYLN